MRRMRLTNRVTQVLNRIKCCDLPAKFKKSSRAKISSLYRAFLQVTPRWDNCDRIKRRQAQSFICRLKTVQRILILMNSRVRSLNSATRTPSTSLPHCRCPPMRPRTPLATMKHQFWVERIITNHWNFANHLQKPPMKNMLQMKEFIEDSCYQSRNSCRALRTRFKSRIAKIITLSNALSSTSTAVLFQRVVPVSNSASTNFCRPRRSTRPTRTRWLEPLTTTTECHTHPTTCPTLRTITSHTTGLLGDIIMDMLSLCTTPCHPWGRATCRAGVSINFIISSRLPCLASKLIRKIKNCASKNLQDVVMRARKHPRIALIVGSRALAVPSEWLNLRWWALEWWTPSHRIRGMFRGAVQVTNSMNGSTVGLEFFAKMNGLLCSRALGKLETRSWASRALRSIQWHRSQVHLASTRFATTTTSRQAR